MQTLTFSEAVDRVAAVVNANPNYVYEQPVMGEYPTCAYFTEDNTPSCLVGQAFAEELNAADVMTLANEDGIDSVIRRGLLSATERAALFLENIQVNQDSGVAWGEALTMALAYHDEANHDEYDDTVALLDTAA